MKNLILILAATLGFSGMAHANDTTAAEKALSFITLNGDTKGTDCVISYDVMPDGSGANFTITKNDDSAVKRDYISVAFGDNATTFSSNSKGFTIKDSQENRNLEAEDGNRDYMTTTTTLSYDSASQTFTVQQDTIESRDAAGKHVVRDGNTSEGPMTCTLGFANPLNP